LAAGEHVGTDAWLDDDDDDDRLRLPACTANSIGYSIGYPIADLLSTQIHNTIA